MATVLTHHVRHLAVYATPLTVRRAGCGLPYSHKSFLKVQSPATMLLSILVASNSRTLRDAELSSPYVHCCPAQSRITKRKSAGTAEYMQELEIKPARTDAAGKMVQFGSPKIRVIVQSNAHCATMVAVVLADDLLVA